MSINPGGFITFQMPIEATGEMGPMDVAIEFRNGRRSIVSLGLGTVGTDGQTTGAGAGLTVGNTRTRDRQSVRTGAGRVQGAHSPTRHSEPDARARYLRMLAAYGRATTERQRDLYPALMEAYRAALASHR